MTVAAKCTFAYLKGDGELHRHDGDSPLQVLALIVEPAHGLPPSLEVAPPDHLKKVENMSYEHVFEKVPNVEAAVFVYVPR